MNFTQGIDLICMGRAAVDLYSEQLGASLENTSSFSKYVGGCPANIAIGSSRLGLKTAMLSRVGNEAMGRFVRDTFIKESVDVSLLQTDPDRLTGLVLLGVDPPDRFPLIFYREQCADMAINPIGFDEEVFGNAKALLISGTHCSTEEMFSVTKEAVAMAKRKSCEVIFDLDYRPVLWGATGHDGGEERYVPKSLVAERYGELLPDCHVVVGTEEELLAAGGMEKVRAQTDGLIVQKRGERGCVAYPESLADPVEGRPVPVEVMNVLGAGDAFMSGFLRGYLKGFSLAESLTLANANGALVVTRHGCAPAMPYWKELRAFMSHPSNLETVETWHHSMQHYEEVDDLCMLAFDHRHVFEGEEGVDRFKWLIYQAFKDAADRTTGVRMGIVADEEFGSAVLKDAKFYPCLVSRCIEEAGIEPLQFLDGKEALAILRSWPKDQVVKVLSRGEIGALKTLYDATRLTGHALLIEFIGEEKQVVDWIRACYEASVYPTWWKLPPMKENIHWETVRNLIGRYDPYCLGVLLLGGGESVDPLGKEFQRIKQHHPIVKGFAVGRTLWQQAWQEWKEGRWSDEQVKCSVRENFMALIDAWKQLNQETDHDSNSEPDPNNERGKNGHSHSGASPYSIPSQPTGGTV